MTTSVFQNSRWIWPDNPSWDLRNGYALFRKKLNLTGVPARARLFITADQSYRLWINGRYVSRGPARGFQESWPYDEIDVRPYLQVGNNLIAVRAYHPGASNFQYISQGFAGLLVAARWGRTSLVSDSSWKTIRQAGINHDSVTSSLQLFPQEHIDLRESPHYWTEPGFDDSAWSSPKDKVWNGAPWFDLEPRSIPLLKEEEIVPRALLGVGEGRSAPDDEHIRDVVALRYQEDRSHRRTDAGFSPLKIRETGKGKFRSYLLDFGRTVVGSLIFEIKGASGGEIIDTHLSETIDPATLTPDLVMPTHSRIAFGDRVIARPGDATHGFFHHYGFRYLAITVRDAEVDFWLNVKLNWIGYPLERKGAFISSDADLNRIWETCAWTQQCCSLDAYVDTPWREQAQWWGDARVQAWNTFYLSGDPRLFRRGIAQIARQTTPNGVTYGHAPTMAHECVLPDFTLIWFLTIWDYYWQTGSTEPLLTHRETIDRALSYFRAKTDPKTDLVGYDDRFWLFLDWTDLFKDGTPTVYNLWLLIALEKLALLYRKARLPKAAAPLESWARRLRRALGKLIGNEGLLRDGIDRKGRIVAETSIHSQTLGLITGLKGLKEKAVLEGILLPYFRGEIQPRAVPSAYWITYLFSVLDERGHGAAVVAFIKKHWLPMAEQGTTWENFAPKRSEESHSHAWSAHPLYHLMQIIGGVRQMAPSWKKIDFRPLFLGDSNETTVPTPHGMIRSTWKRRGSRIDVHLGLPAGIQAHIKLPGLKSKTVIRGGRWTIVETPISSI